MKPFVIQFPSTSYYIIPLQSKYSLQHPAFGTLSSSIGMSTERSITKINLVPIDRNVWTEVNERDVTAQYKIVSLSLSSG
jgi:hypothetical protein